MQDHGAALRANLPWVASKACASYRMSDVRVCCATVCATHHEQLDNLVCVCHRERADPRDMLRSINPREAQLVDAAAGVHVRLRLGGTTFPPLVFYKIITHRPVTGTPHSDCDLW